MDLTHQVQRYRKLLLSDASPSQVDECLSLLERVTELEIRDLESAEHGLGNLSDEELRRRSRQVRFMEFVHDQVSPHVADVSFASRGSQFKRVQRVLVGFCVPEFLRSRDASDGLPLRRISLAADTCLILFHHSYFGLLAEIEKTPVLRNALLGGLLRFSQATELPRADQLRMLGLVSQAEGNPTIADFYFRQVLRLTPSSAHESMTVLQNAWSHLIEQEHFDSAMALLMENASRPRKKELDEYLEMIQLTVKLKRSAARADGRS